MLPNATIDKLKEMRFYGMLSGLKEQEEVAEYRKLSFEDRLAFLVDREWSERKERRLNNLVRKAGFKEQATLNTIDFSEERGLDRRQILYLGECEWIRNHLNVIIEGATGTGKTYLSCALGHAACRHGYSVRYFRMSAFKREIGAHRLDGTIDRYFTALRKVNLIIFDDWLLEGLDLAATRDILEVTDDKYNKGSLIISTQLPVSEWHGRFGDPTLADAIMDRVVHNAYRLKLKGGSQREKKKNLTQNFIQIDHHGNMK